MIADEINNGRPIIVTMSNVPGADGHVRVIVGYDYSESNGLVIADSGEDVFEYNLNETVDKLLNSQYKITLIHFDRVK